MAKPRSAEAPVSVTPTAAAIARQGGLRGAQQAERLDGPNPAFASSLQRTVGNRAVVSLLEGTPVVRRLVSASGLRAELGGPSMFSKTYRSLLEEIDLYEAALNKPVLNAENKTLQGNVKYVESLATRVIKSCTDFLAHHKRDTRASRIAAVLKEAERERLALKLRAGDLARGEMPKWRTWREAAESRITTSTRDISAEGGVAAGADAGAMNEVTEYGFESGQSAFFKAGKSEVVQDSQEESFTDPIGIPSGRAENPGSEDPEFDRHGPRFQQRAVAASRIDQLLNANVIAKTQLAVVNNGEGEVQGQIMEKAKGQQVLRWQRNVRKGDLPGSDVDDPALQRLMSKLDLVDSLCGQVDRHGGNVFVDWDRQTGQVTSLTGIDNDLAFGVKGFDPGETTGSSNVYGGIGKYIDRETGEAILRLRGSDLSILLADLLLPKEIDAAIDRLGKTQAVLRKAQAENRLIGPDQWGANTTAQGGQMHGVQKPVGYHGSRIHGNDQGM